MALEAGAAGRMPKDHPERGTRAGKGGESAHIETLLYRLGHLYGLAKIPSG